MLQQCNLLTLCEELRLSAIYIASRPRKSQYSTCTNIIPLIVLTTKSFAAATKTEKYSTIGSMKLPYEVAAGSGTLCYKSFIRCFIACTKRRGSRWKLCRNKTRRKVARWPSRLSEEVSKNTKLARIYSRTTSNRCVGQQIPSGIILERNQVAHDKPAHLKNEREK